MVETFVYHTFFSDFTLNEASALSTYLVNYFDLHFDWIITSMGKNAILKRRNSKGWNCSIKRFLTTYSQSDMFAFPMLTAFVFILILNNWSTSATSGWKNEQEVYAALKEYVKNFGIENSRRMCLWSGSWRNCQRNLGLKESQFCFIS